MKNLLDRAEEFGFLPNPTKAFQKALGRGNDVIRSGRSEVTFMVTRSDPWRDGTWWELGGVKADRHAKESGPRTARKGLFPR